MLKATAFIQAAYQNLFEISFFLNPIKKFGQRSEIQHFFHLKEMAHSSVLQIIFLLSRTFRMYSCLYVCYHVWFFSKMLRLVPTVLELT